MLPRTTTLHTLSPHSEQLSLSSDTPLPRNLAGEIQPDYQGEKEVGSERSNQNLGWVAGVMSLHKIILSTVTKLEHT